MPPKTSLCRPDSPTDLCLQTRCPHRLCLQTRCKHRPLSADQMPPQTFVCRPNAPSGLLSADPMPPQTSVCRTDAPTDLCLQTQCPTDSLSADPSEIRRGRGRQIAVSLRLPCSSGKATDTEKLKVCLVQAFNSSTTRQRQLNLCESEASLVYKVTSRANKHTRGIPM